MARYTFVVQTNASDGHDDEFNDWYNNQHIADVLRVPGFVAVQRFRLTETDPPQDFRHRYLALYEVETDDLAKVQQALAEATESGAMPISNALDRDSATAVYFEPITDRVVRE